MLNFLDKFMMGHKGYIAGGCFKNIFNGEKIKDIDIFFDNEEEMAKFQKWREEYEEKERLEKEEKAK